MMEQLIALGYIDPPGEKVQENIEKQVRESQFYLARVHLYNHHPEKALPILEKIYAQAPDETRYALRLANCYRDINRPADAKTIIEALITKQEKDIPGLDALKAAILLDENNPEDALPLLTRATQNDPRNPGVHLRIASAYLKMKKWSEAQKSYAATLALDPDNARAYHGLAVTYLRQNHLEDAVDAALSAIERQYYFPAAHFYLGQALQRLGEWQHAAQAYQVAVLQAPGMRRAHLALARIYERRLGQPERAAEHRRFAEENIKDE